MIRKFFQIKGYFFSQFKKWQTVAIVVTLFAGFNVNLLAGINADAEFCQKYVQNETLVPNSDDIDKCFESDSEEEIISNYSPEEVSEITNWATNLSAAGNFTKQNIGKPLEVGIIKCVLSEPTPEENPNAGWLPATAEGISQAIGFVPYAGDLGDLWVSTTGFNVITMKQAGCVDRAFSGVFTGIGFATTTSGALTGCTVGVAGGPVGCAIAGGSTAISTKVTTQMLKNKVLKESVKIIFKEIVDNAKEIGSKLVYRKLAREVAEKLAKEIQQDGLKMFLKRSGKYITAQLSSESFIKTTIKDGRFYVTLLNKKYVIRQFWNTVTGLPRPSARDSEIAVEKALELADSINWKPQISFKDKGVVRFGLSGSTRPDVYNEGLKLVIEVKNYKINSTSSWGNMISKSKKQFIDRDREMKKDIRQKFILDIREQFLYKNPDNVAADFAKELGIDEKMVMIIRNNDDLKKIADFAK